MGKVMMYTIDEETIIKKNEGDVKCQFLKCSCVSFYHPKGVFFKFSIKLSIS